MQSTGSAVGQHIMPDPPGTIRPVAINETGLDLCAETFVAASPGTRRPGEPGVEATA